MLINIISKISQNVKTRYFANHLQMLNFAFPVQMQNLVSLIIIFLFPICSYSIPKIPEIVVGNTCAGVDTQFNLLNTFGVDSVKWNFDDIQAQYYNTSTLMAPTHLFSKPRDYNVEARIYYGTKQLTVNKLVTITAPEFYFPKIPDQCEGDSYQLNSPGTFDQYKWKDGSTLNSITVTSEGMYSLEVTDNMGCKWKDSVFINYIHRPVISDTSICVGDTIEVQASNEFDNFNWSTGSKEISTKITSPGSYSVTLSNSNKCSFTENFNVSELENPQILSVNKSVGGTIIVEDYDGVQPCSFSINNGAFQNTQVFSNLMPGEYLLKIKDDTGCIGSITTEISITPVISDYFSPNNDLVKDYLYVKGLEHIEKCNMKIYSRFGNLITSYDPNHKHWDGTFKNKDLPSDTYWYILSYTFNGKTINKTGKVALIR